MRSEKKTTLQGAEFEGGDRNTGWGKQDSPEKQRKEETKDEDSE